MKYILLFLITAASCFAQMPIQRNPWTTNIPPAWVLGVDNLSVTNTAQGYIWDFFGSSSNTVARLGDTLGGVVGVTNVSGSTFNSSATNTLNGSLGGYTMITNLAWAVDTTAAGIVSGDVLTPQLEVSNVVRSNGGTGILQEVGVINGDDQNITFTLLVASAPLTCAATNAVATWINTEIFTNLLTTITSAEGNWNDLGTNRMWSAKGLMSPIKPMTNSIFIYSICTSSTTLTNTNSATILLKIYQD